MVRFRKARRGAVYLGSLKLGWCRECGTFVSGKTCGICGKSAEAVRITPPGDVRPAFTRDIEFLESLIEEQFGTPIRFRAPVLLNRVPAEDRADEVIYGPGVVSHYRFQPGEGDILLPRPSFLMALSYRASKGYVIVDEGAVESISKGSSVLVPGIKDTGEFKKGSPVIIYSPEMEVLGVGTARMSSDEIAGAERGAAVKNKYPISKAPAWDEPPESDMDTMLRANSHIIEENVREATAFVRKTVRKYGDLPTAVAFSGGKDSLATLALVMEAGVEPKLIFNNTGLEFTETVEYVRSFAKENGLDLVESSAEGNFEKGLDHFGPPGRDYRWCCKSCKLGPTTRLILDNFPDGVLTFIGQRRYESEGRASKGRVWNNPWVPGQIGASPVQNWTALDVWLYIFSRNLKYNPLYEERMDRIGCYLCPASDLAELAIVEGIEERFSRFRSYLYSYADRMGYPAEWVDDGLWRWRSPPAWVEEKYGSLYHKGREGRQADEPLDFVSTEDVITCTTGLMTLEGAFTRSIDTEAIMRLAPILGDARRHDRSGIITVQREECDIQIFPEGGIAITGKDRDTVLRLASVVRDMVFKAEECVGCGVCLGRCPTGALTMEDGRIVVDGESCIHCLECMKGPCPVINFTDRSGEGYEY